MFISFIGLTPDRAYPYPTHVFGLDVLIIFLLIIIIISSLSRWESPIIQSKGRKAVKARLTTRAITTSPRT